jgi:HAD superfamily hydrolase (TIGR01459 family)
MSHVPPIIESCAALLARYDVLFCDVWGVVHDGRRAFPEANEALSAFRAQGGTVILVSNAPTPSENVARVLDEKGVVRDAWDRIVSSGDLALSHIRARGWQRLHIIGPERRDRAFFAAVGAPSVPVADADAIACTGLVDDRNETAEHYRPLLAAAVARGLHLVCANPDLVVHVGDDLLPCAGAIGALYEELGGEVFWAGKPFPVAYETAMESAAAIRGGALAPDHVLVIGDSMRTDLAGAARAGVDALFIASGIHRDEVMVEGRIDQRRLGRLFALGSPGAVAVSTGLRP